MIVRGSTPTITMKIKRQGQALDLSTYSKLELYLSESSSELKNDYCESSNVLTIPKNRMTFDLTTFAISVTLTQEETLRFRSKDVFYQVRGIQSGVVLTTNIGSMDLGKILKGDIL